MRYYYADEEKGPVGPLSHEALLALKASRVITGSTKVRQEGADDWKPVAEILGAEPEAISPSSPVETEGGANSSGLARANTYKELADIAESAIVKLLQLFKDANASPDNGAIDELLLQFLVEADYFTETCCQKYALALRRASILPDVRGTPTTSLARQIRENCFAKTDGILSGYLEALSGCQIDLQIAVNKLQESSVLGAALRGAALGQLAGGFGKTGARLGMVNAAISGFAERDKQRELLWEQTKAQEDAKRAAGKKIIQYLSSVKEVTRSLVDFGCAKAFGGEVDFDLQSSVLTGVEEGVLEKFSDAIAKAIQLCGFQDDAREIEAEIANGPPNGIENGAIDAVKRVLGNEGKTALIYAFKCQIGIKSDLKLFAAITNNRVWFGGIKTGGSEAVQIVDLPFSRLQFIYQRSKNTVFSGAVSKITLKWGGLLDIAILKSSKEEGEYFFKVLKRRVARENKACVIT